ncbi:transposase InsO family protein [Saccharopolyspora dendranthemae]|uniref:Transposase InsO family protein n=1 Tax=Saccharopolyspora dendranthemae TaxID=1181886 RepID=A0A561V871_9PSEU|nr:transposase InsO family protein [Saccharopolyspora dendranthemae]TWG07816.1 transposase InsO family protein [Saccharopolyspora dendranthemae]TWG08302.1 transposase InsO family protein [Saccharopolyspora dendranthemae]TWG08454.1 transposase InsO family protein [Saccharopolyspora dendranthemae]
MTLRYRFISAHSGRWAIQRICTVLGLWRSGYYAWLKAESARQSKVGEDEALVAEIREIHHQHHGAYGAPRITMELRSRGRLVNHKRVERLMAEHGIVGRHQRKYQRTTRPDAQAAPAPDLVGREFTATRLDEKWCGDITYLPLGRGYLYLATVIDMSSRRLVGWSLADHMTAGLVCDALESAIATRGGRVDGVVFHSDRGRQYTSAEFGHLCDQHGIQRSMGRVGSSYDNALAESFFATLKRELLAPGRSFWRTETQARQDIFRWIAYYNHHRRHSALGHHSPIHHEQHTTTTTVDLHAA